MDVTVMTAAEPQERYVPGRCDFQKAVYVSKGPYPFAKTQNKY